MSDAVTLETSESSWGFYEGLSYAGEKTQKLTSFFLDIVLPRNVVTGSREVHFIPLFVEKFVGAALYSSYIAKSGGRVPSKYKHYEDVVQKVGKALAQHSPRSGLNFEFTVVNDWNINAWCLPGGKIAVNLGILNAIENDQTEYNGYKPTFEEKVAAVLSHEITHATARHFGRAMEFIILMAGAVKVVNVFIDTLIKGHYDKKIEKVKETATAEEIEKLKLEKQSTLDTTRKLFNVVANISVSGLGKCSGRSHELEADKFGMVLMNETCKHPSDIQQLNHNSPKAAIWLQNFFKDLKEPSRYSWFEWISNLGSTHPSSDERLKANERTWKELSSQSL